MRLKELLRERGLTGAALRRAMERGRVRLRGVPTVDLGREVGDPATVEVLEGGPRLTPGRDLVFLHRSPGLVVVWKPAGLLAVPAPRKQERSVLGVVRAAFGEALPVHRIDQPTTGVMMVALDKATQKAVKDLLERHEVRREYLALVHGSFPAEEWTVSTELVRDRGDGLRGSVVLPNTPVRRRHAPPTPTVVQPRKAATTHLRRLAVVSPRATLMEARLETGRTHQVRIHLADLGAPILGDPLYASTGIARMAPRLALHARTLALTHPLTGEAIEVHTELPDDLERTRRQLAEASPRRERHSPSGKRSR